MNAFGYLALLCVVSFPIAWLVSEFKAQRPLRLGLGITSILSSFALTWFVGTLQRLNYNASYGFASKDLVDVVVKKLEAGDTEKVVNSLKQFQSAYSPTYESRAHFDKLAEEAAARLK